MKNAPTQQFWISLFFAVSATACGCAARPNQSGIEPNEIASQVLDSTHLRLSIDVQSGALTVALKDAQANVRDSLLIPPMQLNGQFETHFHRDAAAPNSPDKVRAKNANVALTAEALSPRAIALTWSPLPAAAHDLHHFAIRIADDTHYYGGGERFHTLDQKGYILPMVSIDQPGVKGTSAYKPVPFYMSTRGYAVWVDSYAPGEFDLNATERHHVILRYPTRELRVVVIAGPSMAAMLDEFSRLTGRPRIPPAWAFAPWKSRDVHFNRDQVLDDAELTRKHDLPGSIIVIDSPWETGYNDFQLNQTQFTRPREMFDRLNALGFYPCLWLTPFINSKNRIDMPGIAEGPSRNYAEASQRKYLLHTANGEPIISSWWKGEGGLVDFTNPAAVKWWQNQVAQTLAWGVRAFKCDAGEANFIPDGRMINEPHAAICFDKTPASELKNRYPLLYLKAMQELIDTRLGGDGVLLARSGFTGAQAMPMGWGGDNEANFSYENGLPTVILAAQNAALSGQPMWGFDIAGYIGRPTREMFIRATQAGALMPMMQVHMQSNLAPWDFDEQTLAIYRRFAKLHTGLFPYFYQAAHEAARTGLPIIRPMILACPDDPNAVEHRYQFFVGPDLLAAPLVRGGTRREVYFPIGKWIDYWTGTPFDGGVTRDIDAPLERMPLFVRAGALIEMLPDDVDTLIAPASPFADGVVPLDDRRVLQVWPGPDATLTTWDGLQAQITSRGNRRELRIQSQSQRPIDIQLMFTPASGPTGETADWTALSDNRGSHTTLTANTTPTIVTWTAP